MKRIDMIKENVKEKSNPSFESIIKRDLATIKSMKAEAEIKLLEAQETIDKLFSSEITFGEQFMTAIALKQQYEYKLNLLETIEKTYY